MKRSALFFAQGFCCGMAIGSLFFGPFWLFLTAWAISALLEHTSKRPAIPKARLF